jgi:diketogulonate reductase-like aldo/keto reductase
MPVMAYSPLGQADLLAHPAILAIADRHDASPSQIALAAVIRQEGVIAIPKASTVAHVEANAAALDIALDAEDLATLDRTFPPPATAQRLDTL